MLAEAAARAGKYDLSAKTFDELAGGREGLVVLSADDPGFHSSQNEQDNYRQRAADVRELEKQAKAEAAKPAEEKKYRKEG